jgi:hypothetical protein
LIVPTLSPLVGLPSPGFLQTLLAALVIAIVTSVLFRLIERDGRR